MSKPKGYTPREKVDAILRDIAEDGVLPFTEYRLEDLTALDDKRLLEILNEYALVAHKNSTGPKTIYGLYGKVARACYKLRLAIRSNE